MSLTTVAARPARVPKAPQRPGARRRRRRRALVAYAYVAPALVLFLLFAGIPFLQTAQLSLFDWDGITQGTFVGLDNYRTLASDEIFRNSFLHAAVLVAMFATIPVSLGLVIAAVFTAVPVRGATTYRALIYLPQIISSVVVGVIWTWMYASDGPVNQVLRGVGLGVAARAWLGDFDWALVAVGMVGAWALTGMCMVLFVAGVQQIDTSLYDAAKVDGAGRFREFFAVTLPGLRNEIGVVLTLTVVAALRAFDLVFVLTRGGPGTETWCPGSCSTPGPSARARRTGLRDRLHPHRARPGRDHRDRPDLRTGRPVNRTRERVVATSSCGLRPHRHGPRARRRPAGPQPPRRQGRRVQHPRDLHLQTFAEAWEIGHLGDYIGRASSSPSSSSSGRRGSHPGRVRLRRRCGSAGRPCSSTLLLGMICRSRR